MTILTDSPWRIQPENTKQNSPELGPWTQVNTSNKDLTHDEYVGNLVVTRDRVYILKGSLKNGFLYRNVLVTAPIKDGIIKEEWDVIEASRSTFFPRPLNAIDSIGDRFYLWSGIYPRSFSFNDVGGEFDPESGHLTDYPFEVNDNFIVCNKLYVASPWSTATVLDERPYLGCVPVENSGELAEKDEWVLNVEREGDLSYGKYRRLESAKALNSTASVIRVYCFRVNEETSGSNVTCTLSMYHLDFSTTTGEPIGVWVEHPKIDIGIAQYSTIFYQRGVTGILNVASTAKYIYIFYYCNLENTKIDGTNSHYINVNLASLEIGENAEIKSCNIYKGIYSIAEYDHEHSNTTRGFGIIITSSRIYNILDMNVYFKETDNEKSVTVDINYVWAPFNQEEINPKETHTIIGSWRHPALTVQGTMQVERTQQPATTHHIIGSWRHPALTVQGTMRVEHTRYITCRYILPHPKRIRATILNDNDWVLRFKREEVL